MGTKMSLFSSLIAACTLSTLALSDNNGDLITKLDKSAGQTSLFPSTDISTEVDPCSLRVSPGYVDPTCGNMRLEYYYDPSFGKCRQFMYGGCGGNANRFETSEACHDECGIAHPPFIPPSSTKDEPTHEKEAANWFMNPYNDRTRRSQMRAELEQAIEIEMDELESLDELERQEEAGVGVKQVTGLHNGEKCMSRWQCSTICCSRHGNEEGTCQSRVFERKWYGTIWNCQGQ